MNIMVKPNKVRENRYARRVEEELRAYRDFHSQIDKLLFGDMATNNPTKSDTLNEISKLKRKGRINTYSWRRF